MTSSTHTISPLRQRMIDDMRMRKLSPKTQSSYQLYSCCKAIRRFPGAITRYGQRRRFTQLSVVFG